jgi:hypothetical protein
MQEQTQQEEYQKQMLRIFGDTSKSYSGARAN